MFPMFPTYIEHPERERSVSNLFEPQGKAGVKKYFISKKSLL